LKKVGGKEPTGAWGGIEEGGPTPALCTTKFGPKSERPSGKPSDRGKEKGVVCSKGNSGATEFGGGGGQTAAKKDRRWAGTVWGGKVPNDCTAPVKKREGKTWGKPPVGGRWGRYNV